MKAWFSLPLLMAACTPEPLFDAPKERDDAPRAGTGFEGDVDFTHVIHRAFFESEGEGIDLDNDGDIDNAIGALGPLVEPRVNEGIRKAKHVGVLQFWRDDRRDDAFYVGYVSAKDTDEDREDNYSGEEAFRPTSETDANGRAVDFAEAYVEDGRYEAELPPGIYNFAGYDLLFSTPVRVLGEVSAESHHATMYYAVDVDHMLGLVGDTDEPPAWLADNFIDVDADGDGVEDAISVAVRVDALPCALQ